MGKKMDKCVRHIVNRLIQSEVIKETDKTIYETGIRQLYVLILDFFGILLTGVLFGSLFPALIISVLFMLLQRYAGSYHAPTRITCYIGSMGMIAGNIYLFNISCLSWKTQLILLFILLPAIFLMAPVENRNKRLDPVEVKVYRSKARKTCAVYGILCCLCILLNMTKFSKMILFALADISILQTLGKLDLYLYDKKRYD